MHMYYELFCHNAMSVCQSSHGNFVGHHSTDECGSWDLSLALLYYKEYDNADFVMISKFDIQ